MKSWKKFIEKFLTVAKSPPSQLEYNTYLYKALRSEIESLRTELSKMKRIEGDDCKYYDNQFCKLDPGTFCLHFEDLLASECFEKKIKFT